MIPNEIAVNVLIAFLGISGVGMIMALIFALLKKKALANVSLVVLTFGAVGVLMIVFIMQYQQEKSFISNETTTYETEDPHAVSDYAQMILGQIAEDMAKQCAQNPDTVKMSILSQGFYKDGNEYAVQSEFTCSNLMGVTETHTIKVLLESNEDESKIYPYEVYLDDKLVAQKDRMYADD